MTVEDIPRAPENVSPRDLLTFSAWLDDHGQSMLAGYVRDEVEENLHDFYGNFKQYRDPVTGRMVPREARNDPGFLIGCDLCRQRYGLPTSTLISPNTDN